MNQKAKKPKGKKPSKQSEVSSAGLPKPEPIPPASFSNAKKQAAYNSAPQVSQKLQVSASPSQPRSPSGIYYDEKPAGAPMNAIQQLLSHIVLGDVSEGAVLCAKFGMIFFQQEAKKPTQNGAVTKETLQSKLKSSTNSLDPAFFPRLTTSISDALFLSDLIPGTPVVGTVQYEVVVKNAEGSVRTIKMLDSDKASIQVTCPSEPAGTSYIHYPIRIWDANVTVEKTKVDSSMYSIAAEFISSMQTFGEAPSFVAMIPSGSFGIEHVYAKRIFSKIAADAIEFVVTEVQDLLLESISDPHYNLKASVLPGDDMVSSQRVWWECELRADVVNDETAVVLQDLTDLVVSQMDGVGFANKGPWEKTTVEEDEAAPEQWFW